jgi:hypothetical protein
MKRRCLSGLALLLVGMLIACAITLPPAQPARDLKSIADKWTGSLTNSRGQPFFDAMLTINPDGTFEQSVPALRESPTVGTVSVVDEKFVWKKTSTGRTGSFTLHEGDGKRVLTSVGEGVTSTGRYEPAK